MKEIITEVGKAGRLKNNYNIPIKLGRKENGYFVIYDHKSKGPFEKIFIHKSKYGEEMILCYNPNESKVYTIDIDGLILTKKEKMSLEELTSTSTKIDICFDNCELIDSLNDYFIFYNDERDVFFAATNEDENKSIESLKTFSSYDALIEYYRKNEDIDLFNYNVSSLMKKKAKTFIDFNRLNYIATSLKISDLTEEQLFGVAASKNMIKIFFNFQKNNAFITTYSEKKEKELIDKGFSKTNAISFDNILINYPEQMKLYCEIMQNKIFNMHLDCTYYLKRSDNIDFHILNEFMKNISIKDLSRKAGAEISAKRPLTRGIFSEMLNHCFDELEKTGVVIKEGYRKTVNFKNVYPQEHDILWNIALEKQSDLYDEYFKTKRNNCIK